ncbi:MAG: HAL/PAL/TAL family ammonia-lyase [Caulobacteraceae bacterium]
MQRTVTLKHDGVLTIADIEDVAYARAKVAPDQDTWALVDAYRERAVGQLAANPDKRVYGLNTGFGSNYKDYVAPDALKRLQRNLILSHCAGVGDPAPAPVVRATMLLRAASLARGRSVVRSKVIDTLIDMLNNNVTPAVPRDGSVSASGDLAPLSHIAAVVIGAGKVLTEDGPVRTANASANFNPIELEMKEGLALNNGCQYANAWGALAAARMERLIHAAAISTALHVQAMRGMGRPFRDDLHALRAHPGSVRFARWVFDLLEGYSFQDVDTDTKFEHDGVIQDPYNLRCAAQALGPCLELIERATRTLEIEARSVTDNPMDLNSSPSEQYTVDLITSGGHFHGMPLAVDTYGLLQAAGIMARISNLRCARIVDAKRNKNLGPQVRGAEIDPTESGLLIAEVTTAGLCNQIWGMAMPSHLLSLSTDSGQEDHVSMAANVAMRAYEATECLARILAIEMAFAAQAERLRAANTQNPALGEKPVALGIRTRAVLSKISEAFPPWTSGGDRELSWDIETLATQVLSGEIAQATGYDGFTRH